MDDGPIAHVEAADDLVAADQQLRPRGTVRRNGIDMHVAVVFDAERDPVAVPRRLADVRVRPALPVEALRQDAGLSRLDVEHADLGVTRPVERSRRVAEGNPAAVGRPDGRREARIAGRQLLDVPALGRDQEEVLDEGGVPVLLRIETNAIFVPSGDQDGEEFS